MRYLIFLTLIGISLFAVTCKPLDKLVSFNLETADTVTWLQVADTVLTDTLPNEARTMVSETFRFSDYGKFATNKSSPTTVEGADGYNMILTIDSGASNFAFAKDLAIFLSSPGNLYEEIQLLDIPDPSQIDGTINMDMIPMPDDGWVNVINKDEYRFRTDFTLVSPMPDTVKLRFKMNFRLKALPND